MPHTVATTGQGEGLRDLVNLFNEFGKLRTLIQVPPPPPNADGIGHQAAGRTQKANAPDGIVHASRPPETTPRATQTSSPQVGGTLDLLA